MKLRIARKIDKRNYPKFGGYDFDVPNSTACKMAKRLSLKSKQQGKLEGYADVEIANDLFSLIEEV